MKTLTELVNQRYDKKLLDDKDYKRKLMKQQALLLEYGITANAKEDIDCFRIEIISYSLKVKQQFEEVFFATYVAMYDYWYDLTYLERKKQMNIEIAKLKQSLEYFSYENKKIYLPCFDLRFNHLYEEEIVLLDLKQYHAFIRNCANEVKEHLYGYRIYQHGFASCRVIAYTTADDYVLYQEGLRRFYVYHQDHYVYHFSLDPKQKECPEAMLYTIANALLRNDMKTLLELMLEYPLVSERFQKKLAKYRMKSEKKDKKSRKE